MDRFSLAFDDFDSFVMVDHVNEHKMKSCDSIAEPFEQYLFGPESPTEIKESAREHKITEDELTKFLAPLNITSTFTPTLNHCDVFEKNYERPFASHPTNHFLPTPCYQDIVDAGLVDFPPPFNPSLMESPSWPREGCDLLRGSKQNRPSPIPALEFSVPIYNIPYPPFSELTGKLADSVDSVIRDRMDNIPSSIWRQKDIPHGILLLKESPVLSLKETGNPQELGNAMKRCHWPDFGIEQPEFRPASYNGRNPADDMGINEEAKHLSSSGFLETYDQEIEESIRRNKARHVENKGDEDSLVLLALLFSSAQMGLEENEVFYNAHAIDGSQSRLGWYEPTESMECKSPRAGKIPAQVPSPDFQSQIRETQGNSDERTIRGHGDPNFACPCCNETDSSMSGESDYEEEFDRESLNLGNNEIDQTTSGMSDNSGSDFGGN